MGSVRCDGLWGAGPGIRREHASAGQVTVGDLVMVMVLGDKEDPCAVLGSLRVLLMLLRADGLAATLHCGRCWRLHDLQGGAFEEYLNRPLA